MPETGAYICDQDLLDVSEHLFAVGAALIPDDRYGEPCLERITSKQALAPRLEAEDAPRLWFVVSPAWERSPLEMDSVIKNGRRVYYVVQKNGGPSIDIYYPRPFSTATGLRLRPGFIAYHSKFWNPATQQMEVAPPELIQEYKRLRTLLAGRGRRVKEAGRSFIVTKNVDKLGVTIGMSE